MEDIAAQHAAEKLLAAHQAKLRFEPLGPPEAPATIAGRRSGRGAKRGI